MNRPRVPWHRLAWLIGTGAVGYASGHWLPLHRPPHAPESAPGDKQRGAEFSIGHRQAAYIPDLDAKLGQLASDEFPALLARLHALPTTRARCALEIVMREWATRDAPAAFVYFLTAETSPHCRVLGSALFSAWAEHDGETALLEAERISTDGFAWRDIALISYAKSDPARAWELAQAANENNLGSEIIDAVFSNWVRLDKDAAVAALVAWHQRSEPRYDLHLAERAVLDAILPRDPELALRLADSLATSISDEATIQWLREDSVAAVAFIRQLPNDDDNKEALLRNWMRTDPAAALAYWRELPQDSELRAGMTYYLSAAGQFASDEEILAIGGVWLDVPLARLRDLASRSPELLGDPQSSLVDSMAQAWAAEDPQGGLAWLDRLPEATRASARRRFFSEWATADVPAAVAHLLQIAPGLEHYEALVESGSDPFNYLMSTAEEEQVRSRLTPAVEGWLVSLSPEQRATVLAGDYSEVAERFPELAKTWALELPPGERRRDAVLAVMHGLEMAQAGAVREWFPDLPPELRQAAFEREQADDEFNPASADTFIEDNLPFDGIAQFDLALQLPESASRIGAVIDTLSHVAEFGEAERLSFDERARLTSMLQRSALPAAEKALIQERIDGAP